MSGDRYGIEFAARILCDHLCDRSRASAHCCLRRTVYVNTWSGIYYGNDTPYVGRFLVALKDSKGTGHADVNVRFGPTFAGGAHGGTGIFLYENRLYAELNDRAKGR